jgi:hypothetical protein
MITIKSQFVQHALTAITFILVLGALSMIWPGIIAIFLGVFLLIQSFTASQEIAVLSWTEVGHVPLVVSSLRRPVFSTISS